jgi:predicted transcriptional regulator YdeE
MIEPMSRTEPAFTVQGFTARTTNAAESTPQGKIGGLWQQFYAAQAQRQLGYDGDCPGVFGVYHQYESDFRGAFDVTAATPETPARPANLQTVAVEAGDYLVFRAQGDMPGAVFTAWQAVWAYFGQPRTDVARAYRTDFERYLGPTEVEVCIGVVPAQGA